MKEHTPSVPADQGRAEGPQFVRMAPAVMNDKRLQPADIVVLLAMQIGGGKSRRCFMSKSTTAEATNLNPRIVVGIQNRLTGEWVEALTKHDRLTVAQGIDRALVERAKVIGFTGAPP